MRATSAVRVPDRFHRRENEHLIHVAATDQMRIDPTGPAHQPARLAGQARHDDLQQESADQFVLGGELKERPDHLG